MPVMVNRALAAFVSRLREELVFAQVFIRRRGSRFEIRHIADRSRRAVELKTIRIDQLRRLTQFTADGRFRPLKSAPNLQSGWKCAIRNAGELEAALNHLYPGAIADWHAALSSKPPVTHYREFTDRQTGMYRITQKLTDTQAADTIRSCCDKSFCWKRRLWTVQGLAPDSIAEKSLIPCLEPCALLLEFARKMMRIEQEKKWALELAPSELCTLTETLHHALAHPEPEVREADMNAPTNPRRLRRLLTKLEHHLKGCAGSAENSNAPVE